MEHGCCSRKTALSKVNACLQLVPRYASRTGCSRVLSGLYAIIHPLQVRFPPDNVAAQHSINIVVQPIP